MDDFKRRRSLGETSWLIVFQLDSVSSLTEQRVCASDVKGVHFQSAGKYKLVVNSTLHIWDVEAKSKKKSAAAMLLCGAAASLQG